MADSFYAAGSQRAPKVQDLFGRIAARYDLLNDLQSLGRHRYWKRLVVRMAQPRAGERALDLCSGTGDIAFGLANEGVRVLGLDFSPAMLRCALSRTSTLASPPARLPQFVQADAQKLPFPNELFDIVTIGYGLRNLASWETGLREMQRVTRPGGRILILEFGKPQNRLWRAVYLTHLKIFVPLMGWLFCGNAKAYSYILESLTHYPGQNAIADKLQDLGLQQVRIVNLLGGAMSIHYAEK